MKYFSTKMQNRHCLITALPLPGEKLGISRFLNHNLPLGAVHSAFHHTLNHSQPFIQPLIYEINTAEGVSPNIHLQKADITFCSSKNYEPQTREQSVYCGSK